mgnify:CR=1 FL=1
MTASWIPQEPRAGTNLKGAAAGAAWTYLLDRMEARRVLCVGKPGEATLRTLKRIASEIDVTDAGTLTRPGLTVRSRSAPLYDLVIVPTSVPAGRRDAVLAAAVARLAPAGVVWAEAGDGRTLAAAMAGAGLPLRRAYWLTPRAGELRSAVPPDDDAIRRYFVSRGVTVPSLPRPLAPIERRWPTAASRRVGVVGARGRQSDARAVPAYLRELALGAGIDLERHRIGLSARGRFSSRKVITYCFAERADRPDLVVKMTRDPAFNDRLENEEDLLRHIAADGLVDPGTAPVARFAGVHAGLRVLGLDAIDGVPMTRVADVETLDRAFLWLTDLGAASARRDRESASALRTAIAAVGDAVLRTYAPEPAVASALTQAVSLVSAKADRIPSVLMHGDCAIWNAMVNADGRVAFLDWEAGARGAPPLWDLFSLARSHVAARSGVLRAPRSRRPAAFVTSITSDDQICRAVMRYRHRLAIPIEVVAPLAAIGWGFRALREAPRLEPGRLGRGVYIGMLRSALDPRSMDDLQRRLSGPQASAV